MNHKTSPGDERRRFFRIDDEISLFFKKVSVAEIKFESKSAEQFLDNYSLAATLDILNQEAQLAFARIERTHVDIADYLKLLDSKVNLLARQILMDNNDLVDQKSRNVNLSASGLAFECEQELQTGDYVELKLLLTSSMAVVVCYGRVVYCRPNPHDSEDFPYVLGVDYTNIKEHDTELLIKHVVKRQMQQIREHKDF